MSLFKRIVSNEPKRDPGEPTLIEAWHMLAPECQATVEERGIESVLVRGTSRGRPFVVDISSAGKWNEALVEMNSDPRRRKPYREWHTELVVSCHNPRGLHGTIRAFTDANNPAWDPRAMTPENGRVVVCDSQPLGDLLLPLVHERLMGLWPDITLVVDANSVRVVHDDKSRKDLGFLGGSVIHQPIGSPVPWPERALVGPRWWLHLLCDAAERLDA